MDYEKVKIENNFDQNLQKVKMKITSKIILIFDFVFFLSLTIACSKSKIGKAYLVQNYTDCDIEIIWEMPEANAFNSFCLKTKVGIIETSIVPANSSIHFSVIANREVSSH